MLGPSPEGIVTESAQDHVEQVVAIALSRATLLVRAVAGSIGAIVDLTVTGDIASATVLFVIIFGATGVSIMVITRYSAVLRRPITVLCLDSVLVLAVLAVSRGGVTYFVFAAGWTALAGIVFGPAALPLWAAQTLQSGVTCALILRRDDLTVGSAPFLVAAPIVGLLTGLAAVFASRALSRQMHRSVSLVEEAQRTAAAQERARLAREMHDSVAKTLRGMSLAAVALPDSLRRQPALAEQLAAVISRGADAATAEARQLIEGLRMESPDEDFALSLHRLCHLWSAETGVEVRVSVAPLEPPIGVRYELTRIVHEALTNVARHAGATRVAVVVQAERRGRLILTIRDDGKGFVVPDEVETLQHTGHTGIVGMMERASALGGELTVASAPGAGTVLRVRVSA